MGNNAIAPPKSTATISKVIAPKIAFELYTKATPSLRLLKMFSPILGFKIGFLLINESINKDTKTPAKTTPIELFTPIQ